MLGDRAGPVVGPVEIDRHELLEPVGRVGDGVEVLGEAGGGDEVVDSAVLGDDFGEGVVDGVCVGDIAVVGGYEGFPRRY